MTKEKKKLRLDLVLSEEEEGYVLFTSERSKGKSYKQILTELVRENEQLRKHSPTHEDWVGIKLAMRQAEKNTKLNQELLNNLILSFDVPPVLISENKSLNLVRAETNWSDMINDYQKKNATRGLMNQGDQPSQKSTPQNLAPSVPPLRKNPNPIPSFDDELDL